MSVSQPVAGLPLRAYLLGFSVTAATGGLVGLGIALLTGDGSGAAVTTSLVSGLVIGVLLWGISRGQVSHRRAGLARVGPPAPGSRGVAVRRGAVVGGGLVVSLVVVSLVLAALPGADGGPPVIPMLLLSLAVWQAALAAQEARESARDGRELHTHGGHPMSWRTHLLPDHLVLVERP